MMAKAHITVGMAAAFTAAMPGSIPEALPVITGASLGCLICDIEIISSHRGFSHSLMALALETLCVWLVFPAAAMPFAIAFASHLLLDLMNKRPLRLLYPAKKGFCLGWFYADRLANKLCASAGCIWLAAAVFINLWQMKI